MLMTCAVLCIASMTSHLAGAVPIVTQTNWTSDSAFTASSTDLLEGLLPALGGVLGPAIGSENTSSDPAVLTNGVFGPAGGGNTDSNSVTTGAEIFVTSSNGSTHTSLIYVLNPVAGGYDITHIDTYSGWNDSGRSRQNYLVSYATAGDPNTFVPLATVARDAGGRSQWTELAITGLSGVTAMKFDFPSQQNGHVGFREIDVIGNPIPEPTGAAGLVLGLGGLALRSRKNRPANA